MKKLSILAAMFGILFLAAPAANAEGGKKSFKDMTPEQKAEWKQQKEDKIKKCTEMGKSEEECAQKMKDKMKGKMKDKTGKSEEDMQKWKEKMNKCTEAGKSKEECKEKMMKVKKNKEGKECLQIVETPTPAPTPTKEEPQKKKWFFGLF